MIRRYELAPLCYLFLRLFGVSEWAFFSDHRKNILCCIRDVRARAEDGRDAF